MIVRKSIHFTETNWEILRGYMQRKGLESPSLAVADLIRQLLQQQGAGNARREPQAH